ncbi:hypothetical protein BaRGS_00037622, partial [Batillaria attramentaria]
KLALTALRAQMGAALVMACEDIPDSKWSAVVKIQVRSTVLVICNSNTVTCSL